MKALILAAGYAVRLKELTAGKPKPLLEVGGRRIIDRIIEKILRTGKADSIYVVTNAKFTENFRDWLGESKYGDKISLINDGTTSNETRLGAIRDLELAVEKKAIKDDLLVVAGDNLFEFDLDEFLEFAGARHDGVSVALHDIKDYKAASKFGVVAIDKVKKVVDFEEKPERPKSTLISSGIYYFPKEKVSFIKKYIKASEKIDAPGYFISWLSKADRVYGFDFSEDWYDIGDIDSFKKANSEYLKKENN